MSENYNKVVYNGQTLIDLTQDTVSENTLLAGYTAHKADGSQIIGQAEFGSGEITEEDKAKIIKAVDEAHAHRCIPIYGEKTVFDLSDAYEMNPNYYANSFTGIFVPEEGKQYAVNWNGKIYICTAKRDAGYGVETYVIRNEEVEDGTDGYFKFVWTPHVDLLDIYYYGRADSCKIMPYSEIVEQLDKKFIPDYVGKTYVDEPFYEEYETIDFVSEEDPYVLPPGTLSSTYYTINGHFPLTNGISVVDALINKANTTFVVQYGEKIYNLSKENVESYGSGLAFSFPDAPDLSLGVTSGVDYCSFDFVTGLTEEPTELILQILGVRTGNVTRKIKTERVPDYVSKTEMKAYIEETILGGAW